MTRIAFIGLGNMGLPMATNLIKSGFHVVGSDLNPDFVAGLIAAGGDGAADSAEAVASADIVVSMLPSGAIVKAVYMNEGGVFDHAKAGALFIDSSTIDVATAREVAEAAGQRGFDMVDAPVSGGVAGAAAGTLAFMVGGSEKAYNSAHPIIEAMAGKIVHAGGNGNGQAAKICNNMLLAITMIGTGEAFNLGKSLGVEDQVLYDIMANASGQSWSLTSYCPVPGPVPASPANNGYKPGFATALMLKDLRLAIEAASSAGANTPLGTHARDIYSDMDAAGLGGVDFSGVIKTLSGEP